MRIFLSIVANIRIPCVVKPINCMISLYCAQHVKSLCLKISVVYCFFANLNTALTFCNAAFTLRARGATIAAMAVRTRCKCSITAAPELLICSVYTSLHITVVQIVHYNDVLSGGSRIF